MSVLRERYARAVLVGTGQIGGSLLLALRRAGLVGDTLGLEVDPERARLARELGIVDETAVRPKGEALIAAAAGAQLVVLATPVGAAAAVLAQLGPHLPASCLIIDVGSTKKTLLKTVEKTLPVPGRFVGCHPIAGTERSGPSAATAELFRDRPVILTPIAGTLPEALQAARALWLATGAQLSMMTPEAHDAALAVTSHLPHAAAFALAAVVERVLARDEALASNAAGLFGAGFLDTTRIAASDPVMWRDIFLSNREAMTALVEVLYDEIGYLKEALRRDDGSALLDLVMRARRGRARVVGSPKPR